MRTITITVEEYRDLVADATKISILRGIAKKEYISTEEIRDVIGEPLEKGEADDEDDF